MLDSTQIFVRSGEYGLEIIERLSPTEAATLTREKRRLAYSGLLSRELSQSSTPVLNPVAVVVRYGCLCTPQTIETQEHVLAYIDSTVQVRLREQVNLEHTLERYQEKITVW